MTETLGPHLSLISSPLKGLSPWPQCSKTVLGLLRWLLGLSGQGLQEPHRLPQAESAQLLQTGLQPRFQGPLLLAHCIGQLFRWRDRAVRACREIRDTCSGTLKQGIPRTLLATSGGVHTRTVSCLPTNYRLAIMVCVTTTSCLLAAQRLVTL